MHVSCSGGQLHKACQQQGMAATWHAQQTTVILLDRVNLFPGRRMQTLCYAACSIACPHDPTHKDELPCANTCILIQQDAAKFSCGRHNQPSKKVGGIECPMAAASSSTPTSQQRGVHAFEKPACSYCVGSAAQCTSQHKIIACHDTRCRCTARVGTVHGQHHACSNASVSCSFCQPIKLSGHQRHLATRELLHTQASNESARQPPQHSPGAHVPSAQSLHLLIQSQTELALPLPC